ncbi:MAG: hypothetical protein ABIF40_05980 [archaeon]
MVKAQKIKEDEMQSMHWHHMRGWRPGFGFPIGLIIIGLYFIAKEYGFIPKDTMIWPWILLAIGLGMIINRLIRWQRYS